MSTFDTPLMLRARLCSTSVSGKPFDYVQQTDFTFKTCQFPAKTPKQSYCVTSPVFTQLRNRDGGETVLLKCRSCDVQSFINANIITARASCEMGVNLRSPPLLWPLNSAAMLSGELPGPFAPCVGLLSINDSAGACSCIHNSPHQWILSEHYISHCVHLLGGGQLCQEVQYD